MPVEPPGGLAEGGPRSHFLTAVAPAPRRRHIALRLGFRWLVVLALAAGGTVLVRALRARAFDPEGPAKALYWLHDHVALPAWGHAWTTIAPYGAIWLAAVGLLAGLGLGGWLLGQAPLRALQRRFTLALVRRSAWRDRLVAWHRRASRLGLRPRLFEEVLRHERRLTVDALSGVRQGGQGGEAGIAAAARRLAAISLVEARLADEAGGDRAAPRLAMLPRLAETAVILSLQGAPEGRQMAAAVARDLEELTDTLAWRVAEASGWERFDAGRLAELVDDFDRPRLAAEIVALLREPGETAPAARIAMLREIAESSSRRLAVVEGMRHSLERDTGSRLIGLGSPHQAQGLPEPRAGRMAVLAALLLGHRLEAAHIGLDTIEAWDGLALVAALAGDEAREDRARPPFELARALTLGAVDTDIYRLGARLAAREDPAFRALLAEAGDVLQPEDRDVLLADERALALAAGFDPGMAEPGGMEGRA